MQTVDESQRETGTLNVQLIKKDNLDQNRALVKCSHISGIYKTSNKS